MKDSERFELENLVLAPYIQKATALIGRARRVGGNQFRHAFATLAILIDYHFTDSVLLKAAVIHDLLEDVPETDVGEISTIDGEGGEVLRLVREVTRGNETKMDYLRRIRDSGSYRAKVLKLADRISNLTDLHTDIFDQDFIKRYVEETAEFVLPVAEEVNSEMAREIEDLLSRRRRLLRACSS